VSVEAVAVRLVRCALGGAAAAAVVVAAAWALGISRHDLRIFLLGQMTGATLMWIGAVWVFRRHRP
jgi:hypothetical protein